MGESNDGTISFVMLSLSKQTMNANVMNANMLMG